MSGCGAAVVDTSAWIDYFTGRDMPLLDGALKQGSIILPPIVVAELVSGAHKSRAREAMVEFLDELPIHETPRDHWSRVGELDAKPSPGGVFFEPQSEEVQTPYPAALALASTGNPASCQAVHPPVSARAFFHPACLSSCATRALVASFVQAQ
jgi:PIN domain